MPARGVRHGEPAHEATEFAIVAGPEQEVETVGHQAVDSGIVFKGFIVEG